MITYKVGDATQPEELHFGKVLLIHCVNDEFVMGAGIARTIANKWPRVLEKYQGKYRNWKLGDLQLVLAEENNNRLVIGNIFGQKGCGVNDVGLPAVRYEALYEGFLRVKKFLKKNPDYKVVSGRIASGLAGASWLEVEKLINKANLDIVIYTLA